MKGNMVILEFLLFPGLLFTAIALLVYHLFFKALGLFLFFVETFHVYEPEDAEETADPRPAWRRYRAPLATFRSSSLLFVAGAAISFLPPEPPP